MPQYRLAILADIHGNLQALEAVFAELDQTGPLDAILVAGDIICGPDQQTVLRRLVERNVVMIQGNNEQALARIAAGTAPEYIATSKQFALRRWAFAHLSPEALRLVCSLPEQRVFTLPGADPIRISHGSPRNINELIIPPSHAAYLPKFTPYSTDPQFGVTPLEVIFGMVAEPVLLFGHTHLPWQAQVDGRLALNPGAVNLPEDGYVGAQYALLEWDGNCWQPEHHAVPYDMEACRRAHEDSGFLASSFLARIFLAELMDGNDRTVAFFALANRLAEEAGCADLPYIPDEIWDQASSLFPL